MSTQTRLTLSSVSVMTAIVVIISILDLGYQMDAQYASTLEHAELLKTVASKAVIDTLNSDRQHSWREALGASNLGSKLIDIMSSSHALLEIAVCDDDNVILLDSDPKEQGKKFPHAADFEPIAKNTRWLDKLRILNQQNSYQLEETLGAPGKAEKLHVRVVIYPPLIALDIVPTLKKSAGVALASVAGALCITLLFSIIAFRPLGRLGHMLDVVAAGDYDPNALAPVSRTGADEFGIMATKVNLLGQQLRGAQGDFSDLRGNFERLLDQLEDAVLMFGRDRRLVVRTGLLVRLRDPEAQRQIGRQLQTADRLAAISRISGGVAHEVKNPLNAILLHVEVARTRLKQGEADVSPQMEVISREILRLDRVVKTFLDFTRPVELKYRVVPLRDVVREIEELTRPQAEAAKVRMTVEPDPDGVDVRVDRDMFKQAFLNVVVNAIQSMKDGGELRLSVPARATPRRFASSTPAWNPAGIAGQGLPPVLHHQAGRQRHRTRHDVPDRTITRWYNRLQQRTRERHHFCDPPADCRVSEASE
jgi:signal transduction histidine kinase